MIVEALSISGQPRVPPLPLIGEQRPDALQWYLGLHVGGKAVVGFLQLVNDSIGIPQPDFEEESSGLLPCWLGEAAPTDQQALLRAERAHHALEFAQRGCVCNRGAGLHLNSNA
jgi:hypothetical protein